MNYKSTHRFLVERMPKLLPAFTLLALATLFFAAPAAADAQSIVVGTCHENGGVCQCLPPLDINQLLDAFPDFLTACVDPQETP